MSTPDATNFIFPTNTPTPCLNVTPMYCFIFSAPNGKETGRLDWSKSPSVFTGDVDASARSFFDAVCKHYDKRDEKVKQLQAHVKELEDALNEVVKVVDNYVDAPRSTLSDIRDLATNWSRYE